MFSEIFFLRLKINDFEYSNFYFKRGYYNRLIEHEKIYFEKLFALVCKEKKISELDINILYYVHEYIRDTSLYPFKNGFLLAENQILVAIVILVQKYGGTLQDALYIIKKEKILDIPVDILRYRYYIIMPRFEYVTNIQLSSKLKSD